jgi:hypothetical protein
MSPFEYLLTFLAIILGLGITDMLESLHKLLTGPRIRWHWMPVLWAMAVFSTILALWIFNFAIEDDLGPDRYIRGSTTSSLLFLLSSAALPDPDAPRESRDFLHEYFDARWRYVGLLWVVFFAFTLWGAKQVVGWGGYETWAIGAMLLVVIPTALTRNVWYHTAAMLLVIANALLLMFR